MLSVRHGAMGHAAVTEGGEEVRPRVRLHVVLIHLLGLDTSQCVDLAWNYDYYLSISLYYPSTLILYVNLSLKMMFILSCLFNNLDFVFLVIFVIEN